MWQQCRSSDEHGGQRLWRGGKLVHPIPRYGDKASGQDGSASSPPESGYVAHVVLDRMHMVVGGRVETLSPGMAVTAEIKTGRWSVISYLLSPLQRYVHEGIRER